MEIVLGKLLGRAYQVFPVALVSVPLVAFFSVLSDFRVVRAGPVRRQLVLIVALRAQPARLGVVPAERDAVLGTYVVLLAGAFHCFGSVTRWAGLPMT